MIATAGQDEEVRPKRLHDRNAPCRWSFRVCHDAGHRVIKQSSIWPEEAGAKRKPRPERQSVSFRDNVPRNNILPVP